MSENIVIHKQDATYVRIDCPQWAAAEISNLFAFQVPSARFHPAFKAKAWDGTIRLFNTFNKRLYVGLVPRLLEYARENELNVVYDTDEFADREVSEIEIQAFINKLKTKNLWPKFEIAQDQLRAITACFRKQRITLLSPTASGKSFIIYLNLWWWKRKTLIIVPRVGLVTQMYNDLLSYGMPEEYMHKITAGEDKQTDKPIVISTWQSIYKQPEKYFQQYECLIGDEVHGFKSTALTSIATKCVNASIRIGVTGTLDDTQAHEMVVRGLFGDVYRASTTSELQAEGRLSTLKIKCIVLEYDDEYRKSVKKKKEISSYQDEIKLLVGNTNRNRFITNLVLSLKGTTLLLFRRTDEHAKIVYDLIQQKATVPVHYIDGGVRPSEREEIRQLAINNNNTIIVASYGTTSTGVNIPNINNIVFGSPLKSKITVLQSIGRALRLADNKTTATLYDISDNLSSGNYENYGIIHMRKRLELYIAEDFEYRVYNVALKKDN